MEELAAGRSRRAWGGRWVRPPPVDSKSQDKDCQSKEGEECGRVRFEVSKLRDLETRNVFKLALHNRFECLQKMEEEEPSVEDE